MPDPQHRDYYASRAMITRDRAAHACDPEMRTILEDMASSYERLVEAADDTARARARLAAHLHIIAAATPMVG